MRVLVFVGYERLFDNKMESKKYNTWNKSVLQLSVLPLSSGHVFVCYSYRFCLCLAVMYLCVTAIGFASV
jgi:hypothetical protein